MKKYGTAELLEIAREHQDALTSVNAWNNYRRKYGLPHSQTFISHFGSWNSLKRELNLAEGKPNRPKKFDEEELLLILKEHGEQYTSVQAWNDYAKQHSFPGHHVFSNRIGIKRLSEMTKYASLEQETDYKALIRKHFPDEPPTFAEWTELAKRGNVPNAITILRHYGKWNYMKYVVYK